MSVFLNESISCDPSLELSCQDGSNEGSQHRFSLRNKDSNPRTVHITPYLEHKIFTEIKLRSAVLFEGVAEPVSAVILHILAV